MDEDKTADYWVVQDDKVVRVHATPRHFLFDPRSCPFPVPLDYVDVLRYTDSNVKGHHNHVDCWWTDPEGDQGTSECIPGPLIGKTTFHLRLPAPKPGWSIQNGRPTKIEANSKRPEFVWVEEWRNMTKKGQREAMERWDILRPKVQEAREERDLKPIQKFDQQFWETLKEAKAKFRPPASPGMPLMEKEEAAINVAAQVQQFSAFQDCVQEFEKKIAVLESMLPERASQIHKPAPKRAHEERHPISGMKSSNTFGLIHTPVNDYQKIPEARAAVERSLSSLKRYLLGMLTKSGKEMM